MIAFTSSFLFAEGESFLNGISINSNIADVIEVFGEPASTEDAWDWFDYIHRFEDFELYAYSDGTLIGGASDTAGICLGIPACVGDNLDVELFSETHSHIRNLYSHSYEKRQCPYYVNVVDDVIEKIVVLCRPD